MVPSRVATRAPQPRTADPGRVVHSPRAAAWVQVSRRGPRRRGGHPTVSGACRQTSHGGSLGQPAHRGVHGELFGGGRRRGGGGDGESACRPTLSALLEGASRRRAGNPQVPERSIACDADRRRDPMPVNRMGREIRPLRRQWFCQRPPLSRSNRRPWWKPTPTSPPPPAPTPMRARWRCRRLRRRWAPRPPQPRSRPPAPRGSPGASPTSSPKCSASAIPSSNAWPLDERLIDCVAQGYLAAEDNPWPQINVVASPRFTLSGGEVDASVIDGRLLRETLHEADGIESNVAIGWHAVEFLLWGQDLNGHGAGAGARPWTDYAAGDACTGGACDRRAAYLTAATALPVEDLEWMAGQWAPGGGPRGGRGRSRRRPDGDGRRPGQPVLWPAGRRADAAGPHAERPGGGARLLFGQHPQLPFLHRPRRPQRVDRPLRPSRRRCRRRTVAVGADRRRRPRARRGNARGAGRAPRRWTPSGPRRLRAWPTT